MGSSSVVKLAFVGAGLATMFHLLSTMTPYFSVFTTCEKNEASWPYVTVGLPWLDATTCMITRFFQLSSQNLVGKLVGSLILNLFVAWFVWAAVESGRPGARFFAGRWLLGVTLWVVQSAGISVAVPLLWAPSLLSSRTHAPDARPPRAFVLLCAVLIAALLPAFYMSLAVPPSLMPEALFAFNYGPIVVALLLPWLGAVLPSGRTTNPKTVVAVANFFAGVCFLFHLLSMVSLGLEAYQTRADLSALLRSIPQFSDFGGFAVYFLTVDLVVLFASLLAVVWLQSGTVALLSLLLRTPFVGPAAALLWQVAQREEKELVRPKTH